MAMAGGREAEAEGEEEGGEYCWEGYRLGVLFCFLHCTYALLVGITLPYPTLPYSFSFFSPFSLLIEIMRSKGEKERTTAP